MDDSVPSPAISRLGHVRAPVLALSVLTAMSLTAMPAGLGAQHYVSLLPPMEWRSIGPDRGGRSIAVAGHAERPFEYYFGATGGGLFKTTDSGSSWTAVTDGQVGSASVGAVAVAPSDPDIVYIGMGEVQLRANVLQGDGVYRSDDAGKSWRHLGLADTHAIGRIRVHPTNPERVYVAALGHPFGPNPERGVFRTTDGGDTWEKVLFRDERTGAVDLVMDPVDPDVLYATLRPAQPPGAGRRHTDRRLPGGLRRAVGGARRAAADLRADAQRGPARLESPARGSGADADRGQGGALLIADG